MLAGGEFMAVDVSLPSGGESKTSFPTGTLAVVVSDTERANEPQAESRRVLVKLTSGPGAGTQYLVKRTLLSRL